MTSTLSASADGVRQAAERQLDAFWDLARVTCVEIRSFRRLRHHLGYGIFVAWRGRSPADE